MSTDKEVGALVGVRMKKGGVGSSQKCDGWLIERVSPQTNICSKQPFKMDSLYNLYRNRACCILLYMSGFVPRLGCL